MQPGARDPLARTLFRTPARRWPTRSCAPGSPPVHLAPVNFKLPASGSPRCNRRPRSPIDRPGRPAHLPGRRLVRGGGRALLSHSDYCVTETPVIRPGRPGVQALFASAARHSLEGLVRRGGWAKVGDGGGHRVAPGRGTVGEADCWGVHPQEVRAVRGARRPLVARAGAGRQPPRHREPRSSDLEPDGRDRVLVIDHDWNGRPNSGS